MNGIGRRKTQIWLRSSAMAGIAFLPMTVVDFSAAMTAL